MLFKYGEQMAVRFKYKGQRKKLVVSSGTLHHISALHLSGQLKFKHIFLPKKNGDLLMSTYLDSGSHFFPILPNMRRLLQVPLRSPNRYYSRGLQIRFEILRVQLNYIVYP